MWIDFFLENAHFALNIFGALVMFAVSWLYFDAFLARRSFREGIRTFGFILLSLSFIAQATVVESGLITAAILPASVHIWLFTLTRIPAFICILWGLFVDPIQPIPKTEGISDMKRRNSQSSVNAITGISVTGIANLPHILSPIFSFVIGFLYLRRATTGLERHLKRVSLSFIFLGISELFSLRLLFTNSTNIDIYQLTAPFGILWILENITLFISLAILCQWVFGYLLKRFETQLFMIFTTMILTVFLITTVTFTGLLVKNLVDQTLGELNTDAHVLSLSLESKEQEILSDAQLFAQDPTTIANILAKDRRSIASRATPHLLSRKLTTLVVTDNTGNVFVSGEDPEKFGYSLAGDPLVKQALSGQDVVSVVTQDGTVSQDIVIKAVSPVKKDNVVIGAVISGSIVDTALLDGIKKATGLEASIYADTKLSATTIVSPDGITRPIGTQEQRPQIRITVLKEGKPFTGGITLLNRPYFASYLPLLDASQTPIGMLFVGKPQSGVLSTAGRSIELTFVVTAILLVLSIFPAYLISRYIVKQIH